MARLLRAALAGAIVLSVAGCSHDPGGKVIAPTDTKPAPKVVTAGGGAKAKAPRIPSKGAD